MSAGNYKLREQELDLSTVAKPEKTHPWIYVIIPVKGMALFTAFCKDCRSYFSEAVPYDGSPLMSASNLPRVGCGDEVADEGFSSLPGVDR